MGELTLERFGYSMPVQSPLYPPPPYPVYGGGMMFIQYQTDIEPVQEILPEGVEPLQTPPVVLVWCTYYSFTPVGPYREAIASIQVEVDGQPMLYIPYIFVDAEIPMITGREIWGYPKKLAHIETNWSGSNFSGSLMATAERPKGKRIITATLACERQGQITDLPLLPLLSLRVIPSAEEGSPPVVAELIWVGGSIDIHKDALGNPMIWVGHGSVHYDSPCDIEPWYRLAPKKILGGCFCIADCILPLGKVIKRYLPPTS